MAKHTMVSLLFIISSLLLPLAYSQSHPKVANVRVYLQGHFNMSQPIEYGDVFAFQETLTVGSHPNSTLLGYAQGTIAFANNQGTLHDLHVSLTYVFRSGQYNGSTVSAVGMNDLTQARREFPILGGTGAFRLARGVVTATTFSENPPIYVHDLEVIQDQLSPRIQV